MIENDLSAKDIILMESPTVLHCQTPLRHLPKKRLVFSGLWQDKPVIMKFYLQQRTAKYYASREKRGWDALQIAGIRVPPLLLMDQVVETGERVLVFEQLLGAEELSEHWQRATDDAQRLAVLQPLLAMTAQMHQHGLWQEDFYLRNFLMHQGLLYAIDADLIKRSFQQRPLSQRASLKNLAIAFAGLLPLTPGLIEQCLADYCQQRGWVFNKAIHELFERYLQKRALKCWQKYAKKSLRSCTAFNVEKTSDYRWACQRQLDTPELRCFFADPNAYMQQHQVRMLKQGNSSTVILSQFADQQYVVKRYNLKHHWHFLRRCLRGTRAQNSWVNANCLEYFHIKTAAPIAYYEKRFLGLRYESYFVCEHVPGMTADEYFADESQLASHSATMETIVDIFAQLKFLNVSHGDTKATNLLIHDNTVCLLDLDAMQVHKTAWGADKAFNRDWQRFLLNW